jgi:hypothetical protein
MTAELATPFDENYEPGTDCTNGNIWCVYPEPHRHGSFDCDRQCPCHELAMSPDAVRERPCPADERTS